MERDAISISSRQPILGPQPPSGHSWVLAPSPSPCPSPCPSDGSQARSSSSETETETEAETETDTGAGAEAGSEAEVASLRTTGLEEAPLPLPRDALGWESP